MEHTLWAFVGVAIVVIVVPGPDTALTIRNTLAGGRRAGVASAFGIVAGQLVWEAATAAGLTAVMLASERVFHIVKLVGAACLIVIGLRTLFGALRHGRRADGPEPAAPVDPRAPIAPAFHQGLISNLGNPKMAVFFASVFPQFAPRGHDPFVGLMSLGLLFSALTLVWLACYAFAIDKAADVFRRPRVRRAIEGIAGLALVGLGARLATEKD
jgi:threonine/homoserine/homoserine lactone efflux protein